MRRLILALAAALTLLGCGAGPAGLHEPCSRQVHCQAGLACVGTCEAVCQKSSDGQDSCPSGETCKTLSTTDCCFGCSCVTADVCE